MADIFLSYSSEDRDKAAPLARALIAAGHTVWWDRDIPVGADFSEEIEREIARCKAVVVCWSRRSCASKWVRDEAAYARDRGKLVPIFIEPVEPPLGFRQNQTLDFSSWDGGAGSPVFASLDAAVRRISGAPAPASPPPAEPPKQRWRLFAAAGAAAAVLAIAFFGLRAFRPPADEGAVAAAALDPALAALKSSRVPEERAAFSSFVGGDEREALAILERLASDLERRGEPAAAAAVYNRVGALGLLVDQARGLAARRRAAELAPNSHNTFQGLFFDTFLIRGPDAAAQIAQEAIDTAPDNQMRAFVLAHLAILQSDVRGDVAAAEETVARIGALAPADDPVIRSSFYWAKSLLQLRQDKLRETKAAVDEAYKLKDAIARVSDAPFNAVVGDIRYLFAAGAWNESFNLAAETLETRRRDGAFLPTPVLQIACLAGLYIGRTEEAARYCEATRSFEPSLRAIYLGELAAARGDIVEARAEIAAARAIAGEPGPSALFRLEARIAIAERDYDGAQALLWRHLDAIKLEAGPRARRATALRLYGDWMIAAGEPARACPALAEARAIYAEIGGAPGAAAVADQLSKAGCDEG